MMYKVLLLNVGLLAHLTCIAQQVRVSGSVVDSKSGELVVGAYIASPKKAAATTSNNEGWFNILLSNTDTVTLVAHALGYIDHSVSFSASEDTVVHFKMQTDSIVLNEIVITNKENQSALNKLSLDQKYLSNMPAFAGETDIIKAFQFMPGIQRGQEGRSDLFVRGGSPDQNLFLLDGVPLYNVNHAGGFFSVFDENAINSIHLYKGAFPARYGGRLSSIVDIRQKDGNKEKHTNYLNIGILSLKYAHEGPIKKDTSSFLVSLRRSNLDLLPRIGSWLSSEGTFSLGYLFYDFNGKANFIISPKDRVSVSTYYGRDKSFIKTRNKDLKGFNNLIESKWGNSAISSKWSHLFKDHTYGTFGIAWSRYVFRNLIDVESKSDSTNFSSFYEFESTIQDFIFNSDLEKSISQHLDIRYGFTYTKHFFNPGYFEHENIRDTSVIADSFGSDRQVNDEVNAYLEAIGRWWVLDYNAGMRGTYYKAANTSYFRFSPRLSVSTEFLNKIRVNASYARMNQFLHLLSNPGIGLALDLWVPVTDDIGPQESDNLTFGITYEQSSNVKVSVEGYYKTFNHLVDFKQGASFFGDKQDWQEKVETDGIGRAYGVEFLFDGQAGPVSWIASYVLSKNTRRFTNLNLGQKFPFRYDRRHVINLQGIYHISPKKTLSFQWTYNTGDAITLPDRTYQVYGPDLVDNRKVLFGYHDAYDLSSRNNFRAPAYHRLDIGYNVVKETKKFIRTFKVGIYNLYNRKNPFLLYLEEDQSGHNQLYGVTLFPIFPSASIAYQFK